MTVDLDDREADLMVRALHYISGRCSDELVQNLPTKIAKFSLSWTRGEVDKLIAKLEPKA